MHRLALHAALANHDLRAAAKFAAKLELDGVTLAARSPAADLTELSGTAAREVRHILSSAGVQLAALDHSTGNNGLSPRGDLDREIESLDAVLHAAVELGRPTVCVDLIILPPPASEIVPSPSVTTEQAGAILIPSFDKPAAASQKASPRDLTFEASLDEALREIGRRADRLGIVTAYRASLAPLASLAEALQRVACPWFGVDIDPVALLADDADEHANISKLGPLIRHARARDAIRGTGNRTQPMTIGGGSVDFPAFLANLDAAGFEGFVTIDQPIDAANIQNAIQALRVRMS